MSREKMQLGAVVMLVQQPRQLLQRVVRVRVQHGRGVALALLERCVPERVTVAGRQFVFVHATRPARSGQRQHHASAVVDTRGNFESSSK